MNTLLEYYDYLTHAITTGLAQHMRRCPHCEAPLLGSVGAGVAREDTFAESLAAARDGAIPVKQWLAEEESGEPHLWIETDEDALAFAQTLIGRLCGVCGAYDCQRAHVIRASASLPVRAAQEVAPAEETQVNYWDVCKDCGYSLAYCKGH